MKSTSIELTLSDPQKPFSTSRPSASSNQSSNSSSATLSPTKTHHSSPANANQRRSSIAGDAAINVKKCCHGYWCKAQRSVACDFIIFLAFIGTLVVYSTQYRNGVQGYYLSQSIDDAIFSQEMPPDQSHVFKSFHQVQDLGELWSYYNHVLAPALYPVTCNAKEMKDQTCLPTINEVNVVITPPRLFQLRMKPVKCIIPDHMSAKYNQGILTKLASKPCYPEYSLGETSTEHRFNTTLLPDALSNCFKHKPRKFGYSVNGDLVLSGYSVAGYECRLPELMNVSSAQFFFHQLEKSNWIDDATRLINIEFTMYNPAAGLFAVVRVVFERSAYGILVPWRDIIILDIDRRNKPDYLKNIATQGVLITFVCYYLVQLVTEYIAHGAKCCGEFWNILEAVNMLMFVLYSLLTLMGYQYLEHEKQTETIDYVDIAYPFEMAEWVLTMNMILSVMVVFKHIRVSKRLALLLTTCRMSAKSLCSMLLVTLIFVTGFTLSLYIGFGHRVYGLRNFTTSFVTLLFSVFNEFEYVDEIVNANRVLGPGILLIYFAFVDLILVSMLISVVEEAFSRAQEEMRSNREGDKLFDSFKQQFIQFKTKYIRAKSVAKKGSGKLWKSVRISNLSRTGSGRVVNNRGRAVSAPGALDDSDANLPIHNPLGKQTTYKKKNMSFGSMINVLNEEEKIELAGDDDHEAVHIFDDSDVDQPEESKSASSLAKNVKGLNSANARTRRRSQHALVLQLQGQTSNAGSKKDRSAVVSGLTKQDKTMLRSLNSRMDGIDKKLNQLLKALGGDNSTQGGNAKSSSSNRRSIIQKVASVGTKGKNAGPRRKGRDKREYHTRTQTGSDIHVDPITGNKYKHNPNTGKTQWLRDK